MQQLVQAFKENHISVGVIKHHGHTDDLDVHADKDTGILFHVGADLVIGNSRRNSEILMRSDLGLERSIAFMQSQGIEQIIIEGYKNELFQKIVLLSKAEDLLLLNRLENILGVYCTHGFSLPTAYDCLCLTAEVWCEKLVEENKV